MINRDVTKSTVIITIAVVVAALFVAAPLAEASWKAGTSSPSPLPVWDWVWENGTFVVGIDILIQHHQVFKIRNATVEMHSKDRMIGIRVMGLLEMEDSTIKSCDETGYYLEIYGAAIINNSTIEGVRSRDPIGEGIIATMYFRLSHSTVSSYQDHAITFYISLNVEFDYIFESDVQGVMVLNSWVNIRNSSVGHLSFREGVSEVNMWNSTYSGVGSVRGFGFVYFYEYIRVHTTLPKANLSITDMYGFRIDVGETDNDGYYRSWWLSKSAMVDMQRAHVFNHNPFTFEAWKTVEHEFSFLLFNGMTWKISFTQDYYGMTVQDIEEDQFVEIDMRPR
ncbi:MAG: hypothetical protein E3J35_09005 [Methanomassiliicoccales archaeon]|nr:MAG: hypothetical protein E3J35_09005 [Methanomassiliicoccales archaeon]